jgi:regulator of replication initiation timing
MILVFLAAMAAAADFETEAQVSEKLQDLEEKNAELQDQLAALRATCGTRCPRAVASAPVKAKAPQTPAPLVEEKKEEVPEQSAPEATPTPDPKIAELQAEVVRLAAENARLQQEIEIFKAALDRPVEVTLQAPQDPAPEVTVEVNPVVHEKETVNVRVSGFHPLIYGGAGMVFGRPVPEVSGTVSVRFAGGVLPMWDIS